MDDIRPFRSDGASRLEQFRQLLDMLGDAQDGTDPTGVESGSSGPWRRPFVDLAIAMREIGDRQRETMRGPVLAPRDRRVIQRLVTCRTERIERALWSMALSELQRMSVGTGNPIASGETEKLTREQLRRLSAPLPRRAARKSEIASAASMDANEPRHQQAIQMALRARTVAAFIGACRVVRPHSPSLDWAELMVREIRGEMVDHTTWRSLVGRSRSERSIGAILNSAAVALGRSNCLRDATQYCLSAISLTEPRSCVAYNGLKFSARNGDREVFRFFRREFELGVRDPRMGLHAFERLLLDDAEEWRAIVAVDRSAFSEVIRIMADNL